MIASRIAQVANFVGPRSGGIRTVLGQLAEGYAAAGHDVLQIVPGEAANCTTYAWGRRVEVPGMPMANTGYRVITAGAVAKVLAEYGPDRLEVHDRTTLRRLGLWARRRDIPACVVSHERLDRLLEQWVYGLVPTAGLADTSNRRLAENFDTVICTTAWAAAEFDRLDAVNVRLVPLGVDTQRFTPSAADPALRERLAPHGESLLAMVSRLSPEKRPALAIATTKELVRRGAAVRLVIAGDGPLRPRLEAAAADLPVELLGHLSGAGEVAALLATADVVIAPGPVETFGLAALESVASGTPVVVNEKSALPEVIGECAGIAAAGNPAAFADAVQTLVARKPSAHAVRAAAVKYDWAVTVSGFLDAHHLQPVTASSA